MIKAIQVLQKDLKNEIFFPQWKAEDAVWVQETKLYIEIDLTQ